MKFGNDWNFGMWEDLEEMMKKIDCRMIIEFKGLLNRYKGEKKYFMSGGYCGKWELEIWGKNISEILYKLDLYEYKKIGGSFGLWVDGKMCMVGLNYENENFYYKGVKYNWGFSGEESINEVKEEIEIEWGEREEEGEVDENENYMLF